MRRLATIVTVAAIVTTATQAFAWQGATTSGSGATSNSAAPVSPNHGTGSSGPTVPQSLDAGTPTTGNGSGALTGSATGNEGVNGTIPNGAINPATPPTPGAGTNPSTSPN